MKRFFQDRFSSTLEKNLAAGEQKMQQEKWRQKCPSDKRDEGQFLCTERESKDSCMHAISIFYAMKGKRR
jgi:hypothetical protein